MTKYFACYNKRTGEYLPVGGRGYTHRPAALPEDAVPRLHLSENSAGRALKCWLRGKYVRTVGRSGAGLFGVDDFENIDVISVPGRDPADWVVIPIYTLKGGAGLDGDIQD